MTTPVNSFEDILNALEQNPELRDRLRRHILTEELLQVPVRLERIETSISKVQSDVQSLQHGQERLEEGQERLEKGQVQLEKGQARLEEGLQSANLRLNQITGDLGNLRGSDFERKVRYRAMYLASERFGIENPDIALSQNDPRSPALHQAIGRALRDGRITPAQSTDLNDTDIIISGDDNRYAVIEVSITAANGDITRARTRANILRNATQGETFAAIVAAIVRQPQIILADDQNVAILQVPSQQA